MQDQQARVDADELFGAALRMFLDSQVDGRTPLEVVAELNELLIAEVPELGADPVIRADLEAATAALGTALAETSSENPFVGVVTPDRVLDLVRTMARRRLDVTVVLRGFQVGSRLAWREVTGALERDIEDPDLRYGLLTLGWGRISTAIEEIAAAAVVAYTAERDAWVSGARARRAEAIGALLAGDPVDADAATATLGYRLLGRHVACSLWLDEELVERSPQQALERVASDLGRSVRAGDVLVHPDGTRSLSAWFTVKSIGSLEGVARLKVPAGVRIALGLPATGVEGFASSHRQALEARRVAIRSAGTPTVVSFEDVELVSAYVDNTTAAKDLVRRELGALVGTDEQTSRLRQTALAYLRAGGNAREAAVLLGTHKNTVLYRLRQIEEMLGHGVLDRRLKLEVALTLVEQLGDKLLPPPDA